MDIIEFDRFVKTLQPILLFLIPPLLVAGWLWMARHDSTADGQSAELAGSPQAAPVSPSPEKNQLDECRRRLLLGEVQAARELLRSLRLPQELRVPALLLAAEIEYRDSQFLEAEQALLKALELDRNNPEIHRWLAAVYYDLGVSNRTIFHLEQVIQLDPTDYRAYLMQGQIYSDYERFPDALQAYQRALDRAPQGKAKQDILIPLAEAQLRMKQDAQALDTLAKAQETPKVQILRAEALWNLGRSEQARQLLQQARAAGENSTRSRLLAGRIALESNQPEQARLLLEQLVSDDPSHLDGRYKLAMAYRALGRLEDSRRELNEVDRQKKLRTRLTELSRQAEQHPQRAEIRDEMAEICRQLGMKEMAAVWERAAQACRQAARTSSSEPIPSQIP